MTQTTPLSLFGFANALGAHKLLLQAMSGAGTASTTVLEYLRGGSPAVMLLEASVCELERGNLMPGGSSLLTDGEWHWRADTAHYVSEHRIPLPRVFSEHVKERLVCPDIPTSTLAAIEQALWPPRQPPSWVVAAGSASSPFETQVPLPIRGDLGVVLGDDAEWIALSGLDVLVRANRRCSTLSVEDLETRYTLSPSLVGAIFRALEGLTEGGFDPVLFQGLICRARKGL